jgi:outer membrane protein assembly factor BamA
VGYQFVLSNARTNAVISLQYSFRFNLETSGNMLYAASKLLESSKNQEGQYEFLDIAFAQYLKNDMSYTLNWRINQSNNLLFHVESGIALPYLNSNSVPFEKRYFAGGANSVRGWSVRELGPGAYVRNDNKIDYIKQSGDIKLGASIEYRSHLFWKFNAALFVDAGNIWTIKEYEDQPGGQFLFDEFYKQIAVSYGAGLRLDANFLVVRLDMGIKAINPNYTSGKEKYPILNPNLKRDLAFHFAVGYPF